MASLNKVFIIGNLTKDPELRYTPSGVAVVNLRVAANRRFRNKGGEQKEDTCFITAVVWDKQAEACNQYLAKGRPVFVEGRLQSRSWQTSDGSRRSTIEIRAERVQFLGAPGGNQSTSNTSAASPSAHAEEEKPDTLAGTSSLDENSDENSWAPEDN